MTHSLDHTFRLGRAALAAIALLAAVQLAPRTAAADTTADSTAFADTTSSVVTPEGLTPATPAATAPTTTGSSAMTEAPASSPASGATNPLATAPNPRITGVRKVRVIGGDHNVVRSGPGDTYSITAVVPGKSEYVVIAKSGEWYNIRLSTTEAGWIHSSLCKEFDDLTDLEFRPNRKLYSRTGSFILGAYTGGYAFDRKSNSLVLGGELGYYVFDRLQVSGGMAWTHVHRPAEIVESLFGLTLEAEDFDMLFYHLVGTFELLPGRQMVPYVTGGVGSAIMQGESEPSANFGAGTTLYLSKRSAMRWEVRDYRFSTGTAASRRSVNNIEFTLGTQVLF